MCVWMTLRKPTFESWNLFPVGILLTADYYWCTSNNSDILPKKWYFWTKLINIWILQKSYYLIVCPAPFLLLWFRRSVGRNKNSLIRFCSQQISIFILFLVNVCIYTYVYAHIHGIFIPFFCFFCYNFFRPFG